MKTRRVVSLTALVAFAVLSLTGIMLFLAPQGRVAYWGGWRMLGLSKEQYGSLHTTFMTLFLVVGIWHIWLNWKPILSYLKDRTRRVRLLTPELAVAVSLATLFFFGTLAGWAPFRQFLDVGEGIKAYWEETDGSPPWGHAELSSVERFCRGMEDFERLEHQRLVTIEPERAVLALREAGIRVDDSNQPLIEIARTNDTSPQALGRIILSAARPRDLDEPRAAAGPPVRTFPLPYSGLGRMTFRQYAAEYGVDLDRALSLLSLHGRELDPDERLRAEATRLGTDPEGLIQLLNEGATTAETPPDVNGAS